MFSVIICFINICKKISMFLFFLFGALCPSHLFIRPNWDDGPHDVHHSFPGDCDYRTQSLETSDLGLWLVVCVSVLIHFFNIHYSVLYILNDPWVNSQ